MPCDVSGADGYVKADALDWSSLPEQVTCRDCRQSPASWSWLGSSAREAVEGLDERLAEAW